jgi:phosphoglycerate dehydrogenase-like enzyme
MFPSKDNLTICFAHAAYQMQARFELRKTGIKSFQVWAYDDLVKRIGEADIVVASGMWKNDLIPHASKLKFIQSISSGMDQYSKEQLGAKGVPVAALESARESKPSAVLAESELRMTPRTAS